MLRSRKAKQHGERAANVTSAHWALESSGGRVSGTAELLRTTQKGSSEMADLNTEDEGQRIGQSAERRAQRQADETGTGTQITQTQRRR